MNLRSQLLNLNLFHYNSECLQEISSVNTRSPLSPEAYAKAVKEADRTGEVGPYGDSISLMIEPLPRNLASIFQHRSTRYKAGERLFEHTVKLPLNAQIRYFLVSTPEEFKLSAKYDWPSYSWPEYYKNRREFLFLLKQQGFVGVGVKALSQRLTPYLGKTETYYRQQLANAKPDDKVYTQYAGRVPHVILYQSAPFILPVHSVDSFVLR